MKKRNRSSKRTPSVDEARKTKKSEGEVPLSGLEAGESGRVVRIDLPDETFVKLGEMGLTPRCKVRLIRRAPWGDPLEIEVIHYRLAIRASEAEGIIVHRVWTKKEGGNDD